MWSPSLFFNSISFCRRQNNFGPLNDHIITEISRVVTMAPAVPSADSLRWPVTSQWPSLFAISDHTKLILGLCNINEWWRCQRSHTLACFWTQFRVSRDLFTDLITGEATVRIFLAQQLIAASRIHNCTYRYIITYRPDLSNLPNSWPSSPWVLE